MCLSVTDPFGKGALSGAPREPRELNWMRVRGKIQSNDPFIHACALTFMSDWGLLASAKLPHENNAFHQGRFSMSTLDHSMWFHDSFRGDQWLLADLSSTRARGGRGLTFSAFFLLQIAIRHFSFCLCCDVSTFDCICLPQASFSPKKGSWWCRALKKVLFDWLKPSEKPRRKRNPPKRCHPSPANCNIASVEIYIYQKLTNH
jgi:hypothetical protein